MFELFLFYRYGKRFLETFVILSNKLSFPVRHALHFTLNVIWTSLRCWVEELPLLVDLRNAQEASPRLRLWELCHSISC